MKFDYQLAVIGSGSGGLAAAELAAQLGFTRVALVEAQERLGGECLHTGCVPSKALLHYAKQAGSGHQDDPWSYIKKTIAYIEDRSDSDERIRGKGLDVHHGEARFIDSHTVTAGNKNISSKYFLIATGSTAVVPEIDGLNTVEYHTNETIFDLKSVPGSLAIIGGGPIGCEMANAFALLGAKVTLIQHGPRILPREEEEASELLKLKLEKLGVRLLVNADIKHVGKDREKVSLTISQNGNRQTLQSDSLLVATGRKPSTGRLELDKAGVASDDTGIGINKYFQTTQRNIYAIGDCTPSQKFTHLAAHQAGVALRNMIFPLSKKKGDYLDVVPWITYTQPEIGRLGFTEAELTQKRMEYTPLKIGINEIDRAVTNDAIEGFIKVLVDAKGRLLGATVVADNAGELLGPLSHIYYHNQSLATLAKTVMPYPTLSSGLNLLAANYISQTTRKSAVFKIITKAWRA